MNRREFSKIILFGGLAAKYLLSYENPKKKTEGLSLSAINAWVDANAASSDIVLNRVESLFKEEGSIDLVLTPEYSFYNMNKPLKIIKEKNYYVVHDTSDFIRRIVDRASNLAYKYNSNLFLGTFAEFDEKGNNYDTLIQIDSNGRITDRKRKSHDVEDKHELKAGNGKIYRVLPLICSDLFEKKIRKKIKKSKKKFDILAYTANLGQVKFSDLSEYLQGFLNNGQADENFIKDEIKNFKEYFDTYNKNILDKGKIVISDGARKGLGAILKSDLKPFPYYQSKKEYALARL